MSEARVSQGWRIYRAVVPEQLTHAILRKLYYDLRWSGITPEIAKEWEQVACPFPHLRFCDELQAVRSRLVETVFEGKEPGEPCEPQFIWHWPQDEHYKLPPGHVDQEPDWAGGRPYSVIAGVAFTDWSESNGALRVLEDGIDLPVNMKPGDVFLMPPGLLHASGVNHEGLIRAGAYFRWLTPATP